MNTLDDNHVDDHVDAEIATYLNLDTPKSFFLFAGAGSGKTRSLVEALKHVRNGYGRRLRLQRKKIAVITYTNAACDEIKQRLDYDSIVEVSTIHSFIWTLIHNFHADIKQWLIVDLRRSIEELNEQQRRGRGGKAGMDRAHKIESKGRRLKALDSVKQFTYSPTGENRGRDALNHAEVIKLGAYFLTEKPLMQSILVNRFPILLVDESQDTNRHLMDAFLEVQKAHREHFVLGLFGDTMQRIYSDGKVGLGDDLPQDWATPAKKMNHRCPTRVIRLINKIRSVVDDQVQRARSDKEEGFVRLFILPNSISDKPATELRVMKQMAEVSADGQWMDRGCVKTLMLEHHMAARRMGFAGIFDPLYEADDGSLQTALLAGSLPGLRFFSETVLTLRNAVLRNDDFAVAALVRQVSPLVSRFALKATADGNQIAHIASAKRAVDALMELWSNGRDPLLLEVLKSVEASRLFEIPESLLAIAARSAAEQAVVARDPEAVSGSEADQDPVLDGWDKALQAPFSQIEPYAAYVSGKASFGTHQGIKGLEFPRVLVVMDDETQRGFLFSYEKLFGAKPKSKTDLEHEQQGTDSSLDRTRRLLYVTCSRAEKSLALVAYTSD
ncbi:MAG TPA: UvrD-helicase domain-containing protein, partial [Terriglobales bacterium]|nr:UvrD-helicase domain-containing protein [Terriglobales bacterium]